MKISLIVGTINRQKSLNILLKSLSSQTYKNFEVLIIDQNPEGFLDYLISKWNSKLNIIHLNVSFKGLSKARNYGIKNSSSDIIAFPDDDCYYEPNLLKNVVNFFNNEKNSEILICKMKENNNAKFDFFNNKKESYKVKSLIDLFISKATSNQIFLRSNILKRITEEPFDINMGVGSGTIYGSSEETDFLIRLYKKESNIIVHKKIFIFHSNDYPPPLKSYLYGLGRYKLIKKHKLGLFYYSINLIYPIVNIFLKFDFIKYKSYLGTILGRAGFKFLLPIFRIK